MFDRHYIGLFQKADFLEGYEQGKTEEEIINQSPACAALTAMDEFPDAYVGSPGAMIYDHIREKGVVAYKKQLAQDVLDFESDDIPSTKPFAFVTKAMAVLVKYYADKYGCHSLLQLNADDSRAEIVQYIPDDMRYTGYSNQKDRCELANLYLKLINKGNGSVYLRSQSNHFPESDICIGGQQMGQWDVITSFSRKRDLPDMLASARNIVFYAFSPFHLNGTVNTINEPIYTALLEDDLIDTVLTWCHGHLIIINKNKIHKGYVRFVNACDLTIHEKYMDRVDVDRLIERLEDTTADNANTFMVSNQTILDHHAILTEETYIVKS
ncbi:MAG: hypothetical protein SPK97_06170 [Bacteroidales bacterium]|nr:hypothetical protein [Bacteroidales bacterium]